MFKRGRQLGPPSRSRSASRGQSASPMSRSRSPFRGSQSFRSRSSPAKKTLFIQQSTTPEQKNLAGTPVWTSAAAVGVVTFLNGCAQGINTNQHIGRKMIMTQIMGQVALTAAAAASQNAGVFARLIVVYDKETNGATPAATDILETDTVESFKSLVNGDRFTTVYDSGPTLPIVANPFGSATPPAVASEFVFKFYKKCALPVTFSGTGATVASVETGGLFALTYITGGGAAPGVANAASTVRIRYTDE